MVNNITLMMEVLRAAYSGSEGSTEESSFLKDLKLGK